MPKFRRRPTVIEAEQFYAGQTQHPGVQVDDDGPYVVTVHDERAHLVDGDWIIAEPVPGRYYPCRPDVFAATYDRVLQA